MDSGALDLGPYGLLRVGTGTPKIHLPSLPSSRKVKQKLAFLPVLLAGRFVTVRRAEGSTMPDPHQLPRDPSTPGTVPEPDRVDLTSDFASPALAGSPSVAAATASIRSKAGRYEILEEIARDGMGVICRAIDTTLGREVAVKALQDRFAPSSGTARRFADEARITAQLQHPAIPPVHDYGTLPDGRPFLAMKLIKGSTLDDLLSQRADAAAERGRFVAVFEQVCQAVAYAHAHQVIHRDLKPSNIMVGAFGEVQVMDWGLAKVLTPAAIPAAADTDPGETVGATLIRGSDHGSDASFTQAGSILGTLAYMPPEQAVGEVAKIDRRSDVFGLGAILAVILTGTPPYAGTDAEAIRVMAIRGDLAACLAQLDRCGAEPELVALCKRCLAFAPAERPRDAGAVAKEVAALRAATEERARAAEKERAAAEVKAAEQRKRRRWQAAVAAACVLILALLGIGAWWLDRQAAEREKERAVAAERDWQEALAALAHAEDALAAGDLAATDLALAQAESRVAADGPADLVTLLATAKRSRDLVRDLREIDDLSWAPGNVSMADPPTMARHYRAVFDRYGLDVGGTDPDAAAEAVRASHVSAALIAGLSEWFSADPKGPHLRQLLDRLDPDANRATIRLAIHAGDEDRVRTLVKALDGSKVPAWFAASVGFHPMVPKEDGVRLMAAAWRAHPSDYVLAYRCSHRLWGTGEERIGEMLAWAKVAVALRPDSPFAHNQLGIAWRAKHEWGEAEASIRRAIELGRKYPRYAGPRVNLGNMLLEKGDLDGAEASYRAAMAIDPDDSTICFNMGLVYDRRGDLAEAEKWLRKAVADPTRKYFREVLDGIVQRRARQDALFAGRINPSYPAEAIELAEMAYRAPRHRYIQAVRFYSWAFATEPGLSEDDKNWHRYNAACVALRAAAGKDEEMTQVGMGQRSSLTSQARKWLRANLTRLTSQAKDPKRQQDVRNTLTHWKQDSDLAPVRDPASLAAMPSADRKAWQALWRDVDELLASIK
jgi:tetratricopeptide (TPR) repeat protein